MTTSDGHGSLVNLAKNALRPMRRRVFQWLGRELPYRRQVRMRTIRLGSSYGGWTVCPDLINSDSIVYSAGLGDDISFDLGMIQRFGVTVHGFDPTPRSLRWLGTQKLPSNFVLHEWGLADYDGVATFATPAGNNVSYGFGGTSQGTDGIECQVRRVTSIMRDLGHDRLDLLKIDIEGAEHGVIRDLVDSGIHVPQLLVEFHHTFGQADTFPPTRQTIERLLSAGGYRIFDISPSGREYGFLKR
jgi:FkbM family methyltransferase